jgi:hypothetical protein
MSVHLLGDAIAQKILKAFASEQNSWRTAGGIARATGLTPEAVKSFIGEHHDLFTESEIAPGGIPLYRVKEPFPRLDFAFGFSS